MWGWGLEGMRMNGDGLLGATAVTWAGDEGSWHWGEGPSVKKWVDLKDTSCQILLVTWEKHHP